MHMGPLKQISILFGAADSAEITKGSFKISLHVFLTALLKG